LSPVWAAGPFLAVLRHRIFEFERLFLFFALSFGIDDNAVHPFVSMIAFLCGKMIILVFNP
jgi:hypothetical protein